MSFLDSVIEETPRLHPISEGMLRHQYHTFQDYVKQLTKHLAFLERTIVRYTTLPNGQHLCCGTDDS